MEDFLSHIFALALSPFSSHSLLVWIPGGFAFIFGCTSLLFHMMRRL